MGDLYGVLGVPRSATHEQIKHAYRDLARRYHPDASAAPDAARFDEVHDAYVRLSDAAARRAYDETLPSVSLAARSRPAPARVPPPPPRPGAPAERWRLARALEAYLFEPRPSALAVDVIAW
jgi:curved DNA-binding protein CbpA